MRIVDKIAALIWPLRGVKGAVSSLHRFG